MVHHLPPCRCCDMLYLVEGRVLLIEFLPSNTGPIATCVSAVTGCRKPNTGAQVVQQDGECCDSRSASPICHLKQCFAVVMILQNRASLSLTNKSGNARGRKRKSSSPKLSLNISVFRVIFCIFRDFTHNLEKEKHDSKPHSAEDEEDVIKKNLKKRLGCERVVCVCVLLSCQKRNCCGCKRRRS